MIREEDVYRIGRLGKAHGIKGEVSFQFDDDVFDRVEADYLILKVEGILIPFFIEEYRFRSDTLCLVKFEDINTSQRASELTGCEVYFPRALADDDKGEVTLAFLVGYSIIDADKGTTVGTISAIDDTTANLLFCLDNGLLIPANDDLIVCISQEEKAVFMRLPEGLLNL